MRRGGRGQRGQRHTHLSKFSSGFLFLHSSMSDQIVKHFSCTHRGTAETPCSSNTRESNHQAGSKVRSCAHDLTSDDVNRLTSTSILHHQVQSLLRLYHLKELHCRQTGRQQESGRQTGNGRQTRNGCGLLTNVGMI